MYTGTCPDFVQRGSICKHLCFVLLRVLGLRNVNADPRLYCLNLTQRDIDYLTRTLRPVANGGVGGDIVAAPRSRDEAALEGHASLQRFGVNVSALVGAPPPRAVVAQRPFEGLACAICFDDLVQVPPGLVFCR